MIFDALHVICFCRDVCRPAAVYLQPVSNAGGCFIALDVVLPNRNPLSYAHSLARTRLPSCGGT